jgi:hypothetical protein
MKELKLTNIAETPEKLIQEKKRFYRTICQKEGGKLFFKSILSKEKGIRRRFLNEIKFSKVLKENASHPLYRLCPKCLSYSLNPNFPYLLYEFIPGKIRGSKNRYSLKEIGVIANLLKVINRSPIKIFNFLNKNQILNKKGVKKALFKLKLKNLPKSSIKKFINSSEKKGRFNKIKLTLSHGDFSEANIVFLKNKVKIIDWEHVALRNPLYDLADFWINRWRFSQEQKILLKKSCNFLKRKGRFDRLFRMGILEISLRDLILFQNIKKNQEIKRAINQDLNLINNILK